MSLNDNVVCYGSRSLISGDDTVRFTVDLQRRGDSCYFLFSSRIPGLIMSNNAP